MDTTVIIDFLPESVFAYRNGYAIVAIDVIRATTTACTAVALGRRCFPAPSVEAALHLARKLDNPLLAGEFRGDMPPEFEMNNSPSAVALRDDIARPLVLLSSSGTRLLSHAGDCHHAYVACFRNYSAQSELLIRRQFPRVAIIGAGTRGEFREEDQMCCAWIARDLVDAGYAPQNEETARIINRWKYALPHR